MGTHSTRSSLARAIGLGSAKSGVEHWWAERISAAALIPLTLWFIAGLITHTGSNYTTFHAWLHNPAVIIGMILLLIALFHHMSLGLQVIAEDYVHSDMKFIIVIAIRLCCLALTISGIVAVLIIALRP
jgi:succinate dehydrogenase / fumarate reductase membrane anchor subunit